MSLLSLFSLLCKLRLDLTPLSTLVLLPQEVPTSLLVLPLLVLMDLRVPVVLVVMLLQLLLPLHLDLTLLLQDNSSKCCLRLLLREECTCLSLVLNLVDHMDLSPFLNKLVDHTPLLLALEPDRLSLLHHQVLDLWVQVDLLPPEPVRQLHLRLVHLLQKQDLPHPSIVSPPNSL